MIVLSHAFFDLNQIWWTFSRSTLLTFHVHPLSDVCLTVLYFYWSRTLLLNEVESLPPLISHELGIHLRSHLFCWPGRRYCCCCCCYKRTSNTLKSILSFRLLRAFSLRLVYDGQKNPPAFADLISTKSKLVLVSLFKPARILVPNTKTVTLRRRIWILSPFLLHLVSLVMKKFSDISIHPERPSHEITYICFSRLYQVHLWLPSI